MTGGASPVGLPRGIVRLAASDPSWPDLFRAEANRLAAGIATAGLAPLRFEHIGSTAVPGLVAKPIIDLVAGYASGADPERYVATLQGAGYEHRGPQGIPGRELFVLGPDARRTHHLNLVPLDGWFWRDHLAFRDRLRQEPDVRAAYAALKRELAASYASDRPGYTAGKAVFIDQITKGGRACRRPPNEALQPTERPPSG